MPKKLIFILNQELNKRNEKRFGFHELPSLGWNLLIINFRKSKRSFLIKKKKTTILNISNLSQFFRSFFYINNFLDKNTNFFIDHTEYNLSEKILVKYLDIKNIKKIRISISSMPNIENFMLRYISEDFDKNINEFISFFKNRVKSFLLHLFFYVRTYLYFASGTKSKETNKFNKFYYLHNLDCENLLKKQKFVKAVNYVYLDQDFQGNYEFLDQNLKNYNENKIWKINEKFFHLFKKKLNAKVVVATHPSRKNMLKVNNCIFKKEKTFELIRSAKVVFAYDSTAIQMAVLLNKPIFLLTHKYFKNDFRRSNYLKLLKKELGLNVIDIDKINDLDFLKKIKVHRKKYKSYIKKYVTTKKINSSYWSSFSKILINEQNL